MKNDTKLYHAEVRGKNMLYSVVTGHKNYYRIDFHFPFEGVSTDHFDEGKDFSAGIPDSELENITLSIYGMLQELYRKITRLGDAGAAGIIKDAPAGKTVEKILQNECMLYNTKLWTKMLSETVTQKVEDYLQSGKREVLVKNELAFPVVYSDLLRDFHSCRSFSFNLPKPEKEWWIVRMINDPDYSKITLKTLLKPGSIKSIPQSLSRTVDEAEFCTESENELPLFIGTQFGMQPSANSDLFKRMEGREIAVFSRSALSGVVAGLKICRIESGKFITVRDFKNSELSHSDKKELLKITENNNFDAGKIIYKWTHDGESVYVKKTQNFPGTGFRLDMLYPYKDVVWDYDAGDVIPEPEQQKKMPEIIGYFKGLYLMAEANYETWHEKYASFRHHNAEFDEELCLNMYLELHFNGVCNNESIFPEDLCGMHTKPFFKAVQRKTVTSGKFDHLAGFSTGDEFELCALRDGRIIIHVTEYSDFQKTEVFSNFDDFQKMKLYTAMLNGCGSQFDRMIAGWKNNFFQNNA